MELTGRWLVSNYTQTITYSRVLMWSEPEFDFEVEVLQLAPGQLMTFVHMEVYYFSASIFRRLKRIWQDERWRLPPIVFAHGEISDEKFDKFVTALGFTKLTDPCPCTDGNYRPIYVHYRK